MANKTTFGLVTTDQDEKHTEHPIVINKDGMFAIYETLDAPRGGNVFLRFETEEQAKRVANFMMTEVFKNDAISVTSFTNEFDKTLSSNGEKVAYIPTNYSDVKSVINIVKNHFDNYRREYEEKARAMKNDYIDFMRMTTDFGRVISSLTHMR